MSDNKSAPVTTYVSFSDIKERPDVDFIHHEKSIEAHLKRHLLGVVQKAISVINDPKVKSEDFHEDNLCNFKIRTETDLKAIAKSVFQNLKKTSTRIPLEEIAAWSFDNFHTIQAARALLLQLTTTRMEPLAKEPRDVGVFMKKRFPTPNEFESNWSPNENSPESYANLRKTLDKTRELIPIVELILKFHICNSSIIDKAVEYFGETRLWSLNKAKFWDTFANSKELLDYICRNSKKESPFFYPSICPDKVSSLNDISCLNAYSCNRAILQHVIPAMSTRLKAEMYMHDVKVDNISPNICISLVFGKLYGLSPQEEPYSLSDSYRREAAFLKYVTYNAFRPEKNEDFFNYLRGIAPYYHDTAINDLDDKFFKQVHETVLRNTQNCPLLANHLRRHKITDYSSLQNFLAEVIRWLAMEDQQTRQEIKDAEEDNLKRSAPSNSNGPKSKRNRY